MNLYYEREILSSYRGECTAYIRHECFAESRSHKDAAGSENSLYLYNNVHDVEPDISITFGLQNAHLYLTVQITKSRISILTI